MTVMALKVIGHRANSGRIVQLYRLSNVNYVEIDIRQVDGDIVVGHGRPVINRASIIGRAWAWLDYKLFFRDPFIGVRTLSEWLEVIKSKLEVKGILLDLKNRIDPRVLGDTLSSLGFDGEVYLSMEDHRHIKQFKETVDATGILASYSIMPYDIVECTHMSGADGVTLRKDYVDPNTVSRLHEEGLLVFAWTVNRSEDAVRVARAGVDGIISDRPGLVSRVLREEGLV